MNRPSFHEVFMQMAFTIARRSEDDSTKHGCVIVDGFNVPIAFGYNGLISGADKDSYGDVLTTRPDKYQHYLHAEENCLLNTNFPLRHIPNATAYVTGFCCNPCLVKLGNVGVKKVFMATRETAGMCKMSSDKKYVRDLQLTVKSGNIKVFFMDVPNEWISMLDSPPINFYLKNNHYKFHNLKVIDGANND